MNRFPPNLGCGCFSSCSTDTWYRKRWNPKKVFCDVIASVFSMFCFAKGLHIYIISMTQSLATTCHKNRFIWKYSSEFMTSKLRGGGTHLTWKGGMGMSGGQDPLFTPLPPFFRSPVAAWFSFFRPHLEQKYQILTSTKEICQKNGRIFSSTA